MTLLAMISLKKKQKTSSSFGCFLASDLVMGMNQLKVIFMECILLHNLQIIL
jgi:hypothetical protein